MEDVFVIMDDMYPIGYVTSQEEAYEYIAEYIKGHGNDKEDMDELKQSYHEFCEAETDSFGVDILEISAIRVEEMRG